MTTRQFFQRLRLLRARWTFGRCLSRHGASPCLPVWQDASLDGLRRRSQGASVLVGVLLLSASVQAATLNAGPGGLQAALGSMQGGDTLVLASGNYGERLEGCRIPSGSSGSPTTIRSQTPYGAVLTPGGGGGLILGQGCTQQWIVIDGLVIDYQNRAAGQGLLIYDGATDIVFQNGEIKNILETGSCSPATGISGGGARITIRGNKIHDIGKDAANPPTPCQGSYGYYLSSGDNIVDGNEWWNIGAFAMHHYNGNGPVNRNIIRNNYFHDTGPVLVTSGDGAQVYNNVLVRVGTTAYRWEHDGLMIGASNSQVYNNTILHSGGICLTLNGSSTARNNLCWGNAQDAITGGGTQSNNLVGVNPGLAGF